MCPTQPRPPSDRQLVVSDGTPSTQAEQARPGTVNDEATAVRTHHATAPPVDDVLFLFASTLLNRRDVSTSTATPTQLPQEQRDEIRRMEWESSHPIMGILREDNGIPSDSCESTSTSGSGTPPTGSNRRRPRSVQSSQGGRMSTEAHPLRLVEDFMVTSLMNSEPTRSLRTGRCRVGRRVTRKSSPSRKDSTVSIHATKQ